MKVAHVRLLLVLFLGWATTDPGYADEPPTPAEFLDQPISGELIWLTDPIGNCPCEATDQPAVPPSYGGPLLTRPNLTGNWLGARDTLRDNGITWDVYSTNFHQGVTTGGLRRDFRFGGRSDYLLNIDGSKAGLWEGLFIDLHAETLYGESINGFTGALLPVSTAQSIPIPEGPITALTGVKLTQALSENFVIFLGKINTLDTFNQPFTGGARGVDGFMNIGLLLPPVLARTIPYSTFGAGFAVLSEGLPVASVTVFDTNNTPTVSGFNTFIDNGVTINAQATLPTNVLDRPGHHTVGGTYSSGRYAALDDLPFFLIERLRGEFPPLPQRTGSWSVYYLFDQAFWVDVEDPRRSWGVFGSAGISDGNPNPVRWSTAIGVGGSSPFRSRPLDRFGVGYFYIGASEELKEFAPRLFPLRDEHGVELFYNVGITPWFHLTPDLQIITPIRDRVDTSVNFGLRARVDF